jgi:hypothetical protein
MAKNETSTKFKLRTLLVKFEAILNPWEVSAFRGAIIEKIGRENILFNHHIDDQRYLYRYPLVQYKSIGRQPAILCLGEGVNEIYKLFNKPSWEISLMGSKLDLSIDKLDLGNFGLSISNQSHSYSLHNWLSLNEANFKSYKELNDDIRKIELLEKTLVGNILSFAKGVGWTIEEEIKVKIGSINKTKQLKYKGTHLLAFEIDFSSNIYLPEFIGLGKGASHGYGIIVHKSNKHIL